MASYTDAIAQFNPYVQQLPVELMTKVGMVKQAQYDQGVQKVQSYIDNIAGVDIVHDADKAYLQSKLGELGNKLKTVAAGDFSNQQLVNSVGGMTAQISKDPVIQEAIASTSYYKKGNAAMEEARKKGNIGASNAYVFNKQAQEWLSNPEAGAKFRGTYTPYTDVNKKVIDTIGKIHSNANLKDIGYVINPDGTVDTTKILDALHKQGYEGVTEQQIRTVLSSTLDATDLNQLSMDGAFNLRSYTPDKLAEVATKDYEKTRAEYVNRLEQAQKDLLTSNTPAKIQQLNENIKYYQEQLGDSYENKKGGLAENYENVLKTISENPDAARGRIHTKHYIDQIANGFAWAHVKDELGVNPAKENFWKGKNYELGVLGHNELVRHNAQTELVAQGHLQNETAKTAAEIAKIRSELDPTGGQTPYFAGSGDAPTDNLESYKNYTAHIGGLQTENDGLLEQMAKDASSATVTVTAADIRKGIENGTYKPKGSLQGMYDRYIENKNQIANQQQLVDMYENEAAKKITGGLNKKQALDGELKKVGGIKFGNVVFSAKEVHDYLAKEKQVLVQRDPKNGDRYMTTIDASELRGPREKLLFQKMKGRYAQGNEYGSSTGDKFLDRYVQSIGGVRGRYADLTNKINLMVAERLAPTTGIFRTEQAAVTFGKDTEKDAFISQMTNLAKANLNQKTAGANHDPANMITLLTNKTAKDVDFQFRRQGNQYFIEATDKNNPSDVERMEVTPEWVAKNPALGARFMNSAVDLSKNLLANAGSTNIFKDYKHAKYQNLGSLDANQNKTVTLPVRIDLNNVGGNLYPVYRVMTKTGEVPIELSKPISSEAEFKAYISGLTDDKLIKLFKSQGFNNIEQQIKR